MMLQSAWSVLLASLIFPPAGAVLLWIRSGTRLPKKLAGSALIALWSVAWLMLFLTTFFGLRIQVDGSGMRPLLTFYNRESHYSQLERSRAQQQPLVETAEAAAPPTESVQPKAPVLTRPQTTYWTDFRGTQRDGNYDQAPIRTDW